MPGGHAGTARKQGRDGRECGCAKKARKGKSVHALSMRKLWAGLLAVGLIGALVASLAGSASAEQPRKAKAANATIVMKAQGQRLVFTGPKKVDKGAKLTIVNKTNPARVGPHTFTLKKKGAKPRDVFPQLDKAHKTELVPMDPAFCEEEGIPEDECFEFRVNKPVSEKGKKGWDKEFARGKQGDSWYTEDQGEKHSRRVSAKVGKTLHYFCAVHPEMKGKFEVTR